MEFEELWQHSTPFRVDLREQFRSVRSREGIVINGPYGWGEFSPFGNYTPVQDARWLTSALEAAFTEQSFPTRASVAVNAIVGESEPAGGAARRAIQEFGCSTIKIKVGNEFEGDLERVNAVARELQSAQTQGVIASHLIRLDANGRWSAREAIAFLGEVANLAVEYVEQPCASVAQTREVRSEVDIPIAVDEFIRVDRDFAAREYADIAIIKVAPLGGLGEIERVIDAIKMPIRISGALETSVGLSQSLLAAHRFAPEETAGLGTGVLFATDLIEVPLRPVAGRIEIRPVVPDPTILGLHSSDTPDHQRWRVRLHNAYQLLDRPTRERLGLGVQG